MQNRYPQKRQANFGWRAQFQIECQAKRNDIDVRLIESVEQDQTIRTAATRPAGRTQAPSTTYAAGTPGPAIAHQQPAATGG